MEVDLCIGSRSLQRLYHTFKCSGAEVHVAFQCRCGNNFKIIVWMENIVKVIRLSVNVASV